MEKTNEKKNRFKTYFSNRKDRILPATLISLAISLIIFLSVPLDIYSANAKELRFMFSDILSRLLLCGLGVALILFITQYFVPQIIYKILRGLYLSVGIMLFLQSNYLNIGLTSLAGDDAITVTEMVGKSTVVVNTIIWSVVVIGVTAASIFIKKIKIVRLTALVLTAIVLLPTFVTTSVNAMTTDFSKGSAFEEMKEEEPNYVPRFLTTKNLNNVATDKNVVVFVIDRLDNEKYLEPNLNKYTHYFNSWGGFTYFNDNLSMYGRTYPSVAYMLTGQEFQPEERRKEYFLRAFKDNLTLSKLNQEGYSVNFYTDTYYGYYDAYYLPDYINNTMSASEDSLYRETTQIHRLFRANMMMGLYRLLPFQLKDLVGGVSSTSLNKYVVYKSDELTHPQASTDMKDAFDEITKQDFSNDGDKQFSFIHISGCHSVPYDDNWKTAKGKTKNNISVSLKNSFKIIDEYIAEMKKLGVYDNSTIIITGDHGYADDNLKLLSKPKITGLFVKPASTSTGNLVTNTAQVSHENLWGTIFASEGITFDETIYGKSVFDIPEGVDQTRKYVWHRFDVTRTHFSENVYQITGSGKKFSNWAKTTTKEFKRELYD